MVTKQLITIQFEKDLGEDYLETFKGILEDENLDLSEYSLSLIENLSKTIEQNLEGLAGKVGYES